MRGTGVGAGATFRHLGQVRGCCGNGAPVHTGRQAPHAACTHTAFSHTLDIGTLRVGTLLQDAHPNDTDLCCLTSLRRLSISGELLSPAVMTSLAHLSGLTRLSLDLCRPDAAADTLAVGNLCKLQVGIYAVRNAFGWLEVQLCVRPPDVLCRY